MNGHRLNVIRVLAALALLAGDWATHKANVQSDNRLARASALEIVRAAIKAHGGETFHRPRTLQLRGRAVYHPLGGGADVPIDSLIISRVIPERSMSARAPNGKVRVEAWSKGEVFFREGFDGARAWSEVSEQARPIAEYLRLDRHFGFGIIRFAETPGFQVERLADADVEQRPAYRVRITDLEKRQTDFLIDRKTLLIHKVEFETPLGHHERFYWPYDAGDQIKEAKHVRLFFKGHKLFDVDWQQVGYNLDLADELFAPPVPKPSDGFFEDF